MKGYELDRILFKVKKNEEFRKVFFQDFESACQEFSLSQGEKDALRDRDYAKLYDLGTKDELILALARLSKEIEKSSVNR